MPDPSKGSPSLGPGVIFGDDVWWTQKSEIAACAKESVEEDVKSKENDHSGPDACAGPWILAQGCDLAHVLRELLKRATRTLCFICQATEPFHSAVQQRSLLLSCWRSLTRIYVAFFFVTCKNSITVAITSEQSPLYNINYAVQAIITKRTYTLVCITIMASELFSVLVLLLMQPAFKKQHVAIANW